MIVQCSECHHPISDKALSCPNCGAPMTVTEPTTYSQKTVLIEKTSKRYKLRDVYWMVSLFVGLILALASASNSSTAWMVIGIVIVVASLLWAFMNAISTWWHHG